MSILSLAEIQAKLASTNWSFLNSFVARFNFPAISSNSIDLPQETLTVLNSLEQNNEDPYIVGVNVTQLNSEPLNNYIDHRYIHTFNRFNEFDISVKVIDYDQLKLYRCFSVYMTAQRENYPEDYYFGLTVMKLGDNKDEDGIDMVEFNNCMITSVGALDFNTASSGDSLASFDINIRSNKYNIIYNGTDYRSTIQ